MEIGDILGVAIFVLMLLPSFWVVRFVLKRMGWEMRGQLFHDTWKVWLTWIVSSIFAFLALIIFDDGVRFAGYVTYSIGVFSALFIVNTVAVAAVLTLMVRSNDEDELTIVESSKIPVQVIPSIWKTSLLTCISATMTLLLIFVLASLAKSAYIYLYPTPTNQFGIFD